MNKERWSVGLDNGLIQVVKEISPQKIEFKISPPLTRCIMQKGPLTAEGIAICSVSEDFNRKQGKERSLARAIKAMVDGVNCEKIRSRWSSFPGGWSKRQVDRVLKFRNYRFKSKVRNSGAFSE